MLRSLGDDERSQRIRFTTLLAYATGMRISELVDARVGRIKAQLTGDEGERYLTLSVVGKGGRLRSVPLVPEIEEQLNAYLALRGLPSWQECQQAGLHAVRLLAGTRLRSDAEVSLNPTTVFRDLKEVFRLAAGTMVRRGHAEEARAFERASVHWLRHTFGRHAMSMNVRPNVVQTVLGHASLATTTLYSSAGAEEVYEDVRRFTRGRV